MAQSSTRVRGGLSLLAAVALAGLLTAPAHAGGNEFDDGFQDQMGRLVATEAFLLGKWLLASAYAHHAYEPVPHRHDGHRDYDRHRGHDRRHDRDWDDDYDDDWGYEERRHRRDPCDVEYRERVRRDRYGEVVERHEVRHRHRHYDRRHWDWDD